MKLGSAGSGAVGVRHGRRISRFGPCRPRSATPQSGSRSRRSCSDRARRDAFSCWARCAPCCRTWTCTSASTAASAHSLVAAALLAGALVWVAPAARLAALAPARVRLPVPGRRLARPARHVHRRRRGVALLAPFDWTRFHAPFRPIAVSPIGVTRFFSARGLAVIASELVWLGDSLRARRVFSRTSGGGRVSLVAWRSPRSRIWTSRRRRRYEELFVPALFAALGRAGRRLPRTCATASASSTSPAATRRAGARGGKRVAPGGQVIGLDPSDGMLAVAARRAPELTWRKASPSRFRSRRPSLEAVVSQFGLMFFSTGTTRGEMRVCCERSRAGRAGSATSLLELAQRAHPRNLRHLRRLPGRAAWRSLGFEDAPSSTPSAG